MEGREIEDLSGYWIYEDGRVWSDPKPPQNPHGKFLRQPLNKDGYVEYCLHFQRERYYRYAHRLVLEAFVYSRPEGMECRHLDGNKRNNHVSNLCWGTRAENVADKQRHGTMVRGSKHKLAKLTEQDVMEIRDLMRGPYSQRKVGEMYGICRQQVTKIKSRRQWNG